jgi:hypothetical protein
VIRQPTFHVNQQSTVQTLNQATGHHDVHRGCVLAARGTATQVHRTDHGSMLSNSNKTRPCNTAWIRTLALEGEHGVVCGSSAGSSFVPLTRTLIQSDAHFGVLFMVGEAHVCVAITARITHHSTPPPTRAHALTNARPSCMFATSC